MLLKNQWVNEEIKKEIKKYLETNDNQNKQNTTKAVLREKFMAKQALLKKEEKHQIDNLTHHLNELKKSAEGRKSLRSERKSTKQRFKKQQKKINKTKSWFFEKVNQSDKPLARQTHQEEERKKPK